MQSGDPDDMRLAPWMSVCESLPVGGHVLDAGCGAGIPLSKLILDDPKGERACGLHAYYAQHASKWPGGTGASSERLCRGRILGESE